MNLLVFLAIASGLAACVAEPRLSQQGESCAYTAHCAPVLLCVAQVCQPDLLTRVTDAEPIPAGPARSQQPSPPPPRWTTSLDAGIDPAAAARAGWLLQSGATPRAAARLSDRLVTQNPALLTDTCQLTAPVQLRFSYRFVRSQYAADDHGQLTAAVLSGATPAQQTCVLEHLARAKCHGRHTFGRRAWTLAARFSPTRTEETRP